MTVEKQTFTDQPVRLLLRNAQGTSYDEVTFKADIAARLDPGIPSAGIPARWKGSVKHGNRSVVVERRKDHNEQDVWFHADVLDDPDESPAAVTRGNEG